MAHSPRVFYGPGRSSSESRSGNHKRPVSPHRQRAHDSGVDESDAETDLEYERPRKFKRLQRRDDVQEATSAPQTPNSQGVGRPRQNAHESRDNAGRRPLQRAAAKGDLRRVKELIQAGANVNTRDYAGTAALHNAAIQGHTEVVKELLKAGAIVDIRSGLGELDTPLIDAVSNNKIDVVQLLLTHGANPRVTNAAGETARDFLDLESNEGQLIESILDVALSQPTTSRQAEKEPFGTFPDQNLDLDDGQNQQPDSYHLKESRHSSEDNETSSSENDSGENGRQRHGLPLSSHSHPRASRHGRQEVPLVDLLSKSGRQDVTRRAGQGDFKSVGAALEQGWQAPAEALILAAKYGHIEVVGLLLAFGINADAEHDGHTALSLALTRGHTDVVRLLLESGANPNWRNDSGVGYLEILQKLPSSKERFLIEQKLKAAHIRSTTKDEDIVLPKRSHHSDRTKHHKSEHLRPVSDSFTAKIHKDSKRKPEEHSEHHPHYRSVSVQDPKSQGLESEQDHEPEQDQEPELEQEQEQEQEQKPVIDPEVAAAESRRLSELHQKREKERQQRIARMLQTMGVKSIHPSPHSDSAVVSDPTTPVNILSPKEAKEEEPEAEISDVAEEPVSSTPDLPVSSPIAVAEKPAKSLESLDASKQALLNKLPSSLRRLASSGGAPLKSALPLLVNHKRHANMEPYVLDIQVGLAAGLPRLHAEHPHLKKIAVTADEKAKLWTMVKSWISVDSSLQDRELFMAGPWCWLETAEVSGFWPEVKDPQNQIRIELCPQPLAKSTNSQPQSLDLIKTLPIRLALRLSRKKSQAAWF